MAYIVKIRSAIVGSLLALACNDVSWPSEHRIDSLRVLAVQAESASVQPGSMTRLSMLCADGTKTDAQCDVEVAWFADCNNPQNNDPLKCLNHYGTWFQGITQSLSDSPEVAALPYVKLGSVSDTYEYQAPADILQGKVSVAGQNIGYGTAYVYFAACAGKLYPAPELTDRVPVQCRDRDTGALLDQKRFVAGVTTIYAYDKLRNENPVILDRAFDLTGIPSNACIGDGDCGQGFACANGGECVPAVATCHGENCPVHCFSINVAASSFALTTLDARPAAPKSLWSEYYTNVGALPDDARFGIRTPNESEPSVWSPCAAWRAPATPTEDAKIWLVLRDDRGGITWHTQRIIVR